MTSHFALFKESADNLAVSLPQDTQATDQNVQDPVVSAVTIEIDEIRRGARILRLLSKDLSLFKQNADIWLEKTGECDFWSRPLVEFTFESLEKIPGLQSCSVDDNSLFALSREIFQLSSRQVQLNPSLTFTQFMSSMSYRWEIIGLAFASVGMGVALPGDSDSTVQTDYRPARSRKELGELALSATETCLAFCNEAGVLNDVVSWLNSKRTTLTTLIYGDKDYRSWRALGDLSTIVFSLGFNQPLPDPDTPFWLSETRKRLMGHAFSTDKQLATFLGRPPRISWRFCNISLPLDLEFKDIIAEPEVRDLAISKLDSDGWNKIENNKQAVWLRVSLIMGPVRESVLELSLNHQVEDLPARVKELLQQSELTWASLPSFLHRRHDPEAPSAAELLTCEHSVYLQLHLDYMYNKFMLHRILSKRLDIWSPDLVKVSQEILEDVLLLIDTRVRSMKLTPELSWVISFFGLSSAGVLSIELVRRASHLNIDDSSVAVTTPFPRSRVIQALSNFASYLQTIVQPHEGNYDICQQARETIGHVLDFVLTDVPKPEVSTAKPHSPTNAEFPDAIGILDYNYYITHLDNWQFELQDTLQMF
ncbi:uncharacterized protein N7483_006066 [Penicillium malachiteum]|uniref:uncharacterized protein n=1 Tax=Penicillium malachiteum TaxID=1324776 RepID=UPI0025466B27|nr:uncharacterized protein N7483_006066 [Penicillium malachiteum]KAJ5731558.1 hypothetical protein N7483_006066 [Penicillium malachiteum]